MQPERVSVIPLPTLVAIHGALLPSSRRKAAAHKVAIFRSALESDSNLLSLSHEFNIATSQMCMCRFIYTTFLGRLRGYYANAVRLSNDLTITIVAEPHDSKITK